MSFGGETIETGVNNARPLLDESKLCQTSAQEVSRHKNQLPKSRFSDFQRVWAEALPGEAIVTLDGIHPSLQMRQSLTRTLRIKMVSY